MKSLFTPALLAATLLGTTGTGRAGLVSDPLGLQNGTLTYRAAPGAVNTVTITQQNARVILTDSTAPLPPCAPIQGMQRPNPNTISLPANSVQQVSVDLGDLDDSFDAQGFPRPVNIVGGDGADFVRGGSGGDTICGGNGNDSITGDAGNDTLWGGGGTDELCGGMDDDQLHGDDGSDTLQGDDGDDTLWGDSGTDSLFGGIGSDTLHGELSDSALYGRDTNLTGTDGNDLIIIVNTSLCGGADDDQLLPPMNGCAAHDVVSFQDFHFSPEKEAALGQALQSMGFEEMEFVGN